MCELKATFSAVAWSRTSMECKTDARVKEESRDKTTNKNPQIEHILMHNFQEYRQAMKSYKGFENNKKKRIELTSNMLSLRLR